MGSTESEKEAPLASTVTSARGGPGWGDVFMGGLVVGVTEGLALGDLGLLEVGRVEGDWEDETALDSLEDLGAWVEREEHWAATWPGLLHS